LGVVLGKSGFAIGLAGENASHGAFHKEKPHLAEAEWAE
jgi:hypothetical protein